MRHVHFGLWSGCVVPRDSGRRLSNCLRLLSGRSPGEDGGRWSTAWCVHRGGGAVLQQLRLTAHAPSGAAEQQCPRLRISQKGLRDGRQTVVFLSPASGRSAATQKLQLVQEGARRGPGGAAGDEPWHLAPNQLLHVLLSKVFLPMEYPQSVTSNYLIFVRVMFLQMFFSHVSRVLATQAMLLAVGVGSGTALPLAAVTAWILKDGLGHLCAIAFGTLVNTRFDSDPKRFRFQAALLGKLADFLSIFTLGRPELFLALSTLGSACGRISSSTAQSCRAKVYETFALHSNLGDVLRCASAQTVTAQLLGTGAGALLGLWVGNDLTRLFTGNILLSCASVYCAYRSSGIVQMRTLNVQRAELIFFEVVRHILCTPLKAGRGSTDNQEKASSDQEESPPRLILSVEEVQEAEVFVRPYRSVFPGAELRINPPVHEQYLVLTPSASLQSSKYTLAVVDDSHQAGTAAATAIWYHVGATAPEAIRGFFHACILRTLLHESSRRTQQAKSAGELAELSPATRSGDPLGCAYAQAADLQDRWWTSVDSALTEAGWRTDVAFLDVKDRRISVEARAPSNA